MKIEKDEFLIDGGKSAVMTMRRLGIAIPDFFSNPGISGLKNANTGIPGLSP